jgi:hypothetical protein
MARAQDLNENSIIDGAFSNTTEQTERYNS